MNEYKVGTKEHLSATITADVILQDQTVEFSLDRGVTWIPGGWEGSPGFARVARTVEAITFPVPRRGVVLVRVTAAEEQPVLEAGEYKVTPV